MKKKYCINIGVEERRRKYKEAIPELTKEWTEKTCEGKTLNLFAGRTKLNIDEIRNDLDDEALADYQKDALQFVKEWDGVRCLYFLIF